VPANGVRNGWAAFTVEATDGTSHIYLGREGEVPHPVVVEGAKTGGEACPAFSPDGTRLMIWRFRELEILSVAEDGSVTPVASVPLQDGTEPTCATWAPDGRWIAFYDTGGVFVADTVTGTARQVVDYLPTDLEWRPGSDELAIAGEVDGEAVIGSWSNGPLILYSVSTEQTHTIANIDVRDIAWSPDGATLAYTQYTWDGIGGHERTSGIALMNADGSNRRSLTTNDHRAYIQKEVTIQWSPRGDLIAYGRPCDGCPGPVEVVLVTTTDEDPAKPLGTETVVSPPVIETAGGSVAWYPATFSWAPDGSRLLYESTATSSGPGGVVVVPIASDEPPRQLSDRSDVPGRLSEPVDPTQRWARAG
jgi:Tol biopolymer transport system component